MAATYKSVVLLGAGASKAAKLPDAHELTRNVYDYLCTRSPRQAKLFGYVIARLTARNVADGGSPFAPVNIETAYDTLLRLVLHSQDPLSDFVTSWDPQIARLFSGIDRKRFERAFSIAVTDAIAKGNRSLGRFSRGGLGDLIEIMEGKVPSDRNDGLRALDTFFRALVECLKHDRLESVYLSDLVETCFLNKAPIATLNYDLVAENACEARSIKYDYGLDSWNNKDVVKFERGKLNLMKLHGSINWHGDLDKIEIVDQENVSGQCQMIFGTGEGKLRPDGPFLQRRYELERRLMNASKLFVIGYSFGDNHLNAMIRRWANTRTDRRIGSMVVVNPEQIRFMQHRIAPIPVTMKDDTKTKKLFRIITWRNRAEEVMPDLVPLLDDTISPSDIPTSVDRTSEPLLVTA